MNLTLIRLSFVGVFSGGGIGVVNSLQRFHVCDFYFSRYFCPVFRASGVRDVRFRNGMIRNVLCSGIEIGSTVYSSQVLECGSYVEVKSVIFNNCVKSGGGGGGFSCTCMSASVIVEKSQFFKCSANGVFAAGLRSDCCGGACAIQSNSCNLSECVFIECRGVATSPTFYIYCPFNSNVYIDMITQNLCGYGIEYDTWCVDLSNTSVKCANITNPLLSGGWSGGHVGYAAKWARILYLDVRNSQSKYVFGNSVSESSPVDMVDYCNFINHTCSISVIRVYQSSKYSECIFYKCSGSFLYGTPSPQFSKCVLDSVYSSIGLSHTKCLFVTSYNIYSMNNYCSKHIPTRLFFRRPIIATLFLGSIIRLV